MNAKKAQTIAIVFLSYLAISGLYFEFNRKLLYTPLKFLPYNLFRHINLNFLVFDTDFSIFGYNNYDVLTIVFYLFLIVALVIYFISKGKERKFLLFITSFLFINSCIVFIIYQFERLFNKRPYFNEGYILIQSLDIMIEILKIIVLYFAIKILSLKSEYIESKIDANTSQKEEKLSAREILNQSFDKKKITHYKYEKSSKGIRFIHYLIDSFFILLIASNYIYLAKAISLSHNAHTRELLFVKFFGNDLALPILLLFHSLLYYLISEFLFQKSPAKFLTNSSVLANKGNKAVLSDIIARTLCRRIPFETFSFLGTTGWHDGISNTTVFKEQNNGWKVKSVILTFFTGILLVGVFFIFNNDLEKYVRTIVKASIEKKKEEIHLKKINTLSKNDFILLERKSEYQITEAITVFKVENISENILTGVIFNTHQAENLSLLEFYNQNKDSLPKVQLDLKDLIKSANNPNGELLFENSNHYVYKDIYDVTKPCLLINSDQYNSNLYFVNIGKPCTITAVNTDFYTTNANEVVSLPVKLITTSYSQRAYELGVKLFEKPFNDNFEVKIHLEDENKKKYTLLFTNLDYENYTLEYID